MATSLTTLGLELPTDPRWVNIAEMNIGDILTDHAWCEQKAASSCISLIVQYSDKVKLVDMLTPVVAEEWGHFQRVLKELRKRNLPLGRQRKDLYVNALQAELRASGDYYDQLMERLLLNALIEARSCERFKLLSEHLTDEGLRRFYHELMISEAGHYRNFIELAETYVDAGRVRQRWKEILALEARILANMDIRGDRMH
ncbi:tRNA-hydroxylase [Fibrella aestuarina BUZ 2]|uniref:tRNA-hydroxylase n=1 Tax=Fibrella aestuarina BUZ 2 TaxID=1166018 RepID=I0K985_9BACT|nr:tRNA-(ms[2]io[6]A)-hydroxylase [Fibrella aestuarina]CCH00688.1 tRNA-hydroxylase [Fibrella aestuarina BUZ 2]